MALTKRRRAFVEHYLQCFNATEAAKRAEYSPKTAYSIGHELLKIPEVSAAIEARLNELKMQADEVLVRLTDQARGSMADFLRVNEQGDVMFDFKAAKSANKLGLVKKFKKTTRATESGNVVTIEFELYDAQAALVQLGKANGALKEGTQTIRVQMVDDLTDDELTAIAAGQ